MNLTGSERMMDQRERIIPENAPTHEQLRRLAAIGVNSAVQRNTLKHVRRRREGMTEPSHYVVDEIDLMGDALLDQDEPTQVRHRMAIRVGARRRDDEPKVLSLKFFDTYWVEHAPGEWRGERTLYRFEWNRSSVLMAERAFRLIGIEQPDMDLEYYLDHLAIKDDMADIWHAEQEVGTVTSGDCEQIITAAHDYFSVVDALHERARHKDSLRK